MDETKYGSQSCTYNAICTECDFEQEATARYV